jgi:hypothetical protein
VHRQIKGTCAAPYFFCWSKLDILPKWNTQVMAAILNPLSAEWYFTPECMLQ